MWHNRTQVPQHDNPNHEAQLTICWVGAVRLLVKDEEIMDRWREYFDKLFNGESESPTLEFCEENSGGRDRRGFEEDEER